VLVLPRGVTTAATANELFLSAVGDPDALADSNTFYDGDWKTVSGNWKEFSVDKLDFVGVGEPTGSKISAAPIYLQLLQQEMLACKKWGLRIGCNVTPDGVTVHLALDVSNMPAETATACGIDTSKALVVRFQWLDSTHYMGAAPTPSRKTLTVRQSSSVAKLDGCSTLPSWEQFGLWWTIEQRLSEHLQAGWQRFSETANDVAKLVEKEVAQLTPAVRDILDMFEWPLTDRPLAELALKLAKNNADEALAILFDDRRERQLREELGLLPQAKPHSANELVPDVDALGRKLIGPTAPNSPPPPQAPPPLPPAAQVPPPPGASDAPPLPAPDASVPPSLPHSLEALFDSTLDSAATTSSTSTADATEMVVVAPAASEPTTMTATSTTTTPVATTTTATTAPSATAPPAIATTPSTPSTTDTSTTTATTAPPVTAPPAIATPTTTTTSSSSSSPTSVSPSDLAAVRAVATPIAMPKRDAIDKSDSLYWATSEFVKAQLAGIAKRCVICNAEHPIERLKPTICSNQLCSFQFTSLGLGVDVEREIIRSPEIVDLLICFTAAGTLQPDRFNPFPDVQRRVGKADESFNSNAHLLQAAIVQMPKVADLVQMARDGTLRASLEKLHPLLYLLLRWIVSTTLAHIELLHDKSVPPKFAGLQCQYQFVMRCAAPAREAQFRELCRKHGGSFFVWHGSGLGNWHNIVRFGLKNMSGTAFQSSGAAYGPGIYAAHDSTTSYGYSGNTSNPWMNTMFGVGMRCLALCEEVDHGTKMLCLGKVHRPGCLHSPSSPYFRIEDEDMIVTRLFIIFQAHESANINADQCYAFFKKHLRN
jgi:hypothetical protein